MTDSSVVRLGWDDLPAGTQWLFHVWADGADLQWARSAWSILDDAGLTRFDDEIGRYRVLGRLLALATLYHSFCQAAWEEGAAVPGEWASDLELNAFRLGQLMGADFANNAELDLDELVRECAHELVEEEYPAVKEALESVFGNQSLLFAFLWLSRDPELSGQRFYDRDVLDEVLNEDPFAKLPGFEWLTCGAPIRFA